MTRYKKLVYGRQKAFDKHLAEHIAKGWKVVKTEIITYPLSKCRAYTAELEKQTKQ